MQRKFSMNNDLAWDKEKGELRILGRRQTAMTPQTLCNTLDTLVGTQVAEVIMNNLEFRSGKDEAEMLRNERPGASVGEMIDLLIKYDALSGVGITTVSLPKSQESHIVVKIWNPSVRGSVGAARAFLFSWWSGALTALLNTTIEINDVSYDEERNIMVCTLLLRSNK
jgi:hypothetical protein